ncbi:MAG: amino acid ABC transporter ATP-binding protein [Myxococcales bacterium]|nr:amino acid ABC transporter ATP-binding protein [Myxococcales bacterium]
MIALRAVKKTFAERTVLAGVSLAVEPGEIVTITGPSGAGKSTLLRCINGLAGFDEGEIVVGPHTIRPSADPLRAAAAARTLLGMVFQDFQLFPHLTARANVAEAPIHVRGVERRAALARADELLASVGLAGHGDAYPRTLSGGQKQRVAIARALAMEPEALLCDEVTSALDDEAQSEVLDVLARLAADGMTLVLVTHQRSVVERLAAREVVLRDGALGAR